MLIYSNEITNYHSSYLDRCRPERDNIETGVDEFESHRVLVGEVTVQETQRHK